MSEEGHNSADQRLRLFIERIERLEEDKKAVADDIRDAYADAKSVGYDTKIMREVIRLRKLSKDDLSERNHILATYGLALGLDLI